MVRFPRFVSALLLLAALPAWAESAPAPAPSAAVIPEWSMGALCIRDFGKTIDKAGAYANQVLPNLGALAKQGLLNVLFRAFPVNSGLKADAPAYIYVLDPVASGHGDEPCYVLSVDNVAELKNSLINALGMPTEQDGMLVFTLPQPLPQPDKLLVAKFEGDKLLVAPDAELLKKLTDFTKATPAAALLGDAPGDAVLTAKVERFKRSFGKILEGSLEMGALMAAQGEPKTAAKLTSQVQAFTEALWQVDVIEARLTFESGADKSMTVVLDLRARPAPGSKLAKVFDQKVPTVSGRMDKLIPADAPLAMAFNLQGKEVADSLRDLMAAPNPDDKTPAGVKMVLTEVLPAILKGVESSYGDGIVAVNNKGGGLTALLAVETPDPAAATAALKDSLQKSAKALDAAIKEDVANSGGNVEKAELVTFKAGDEAGTPAWTIDIPVLEPQDRADLERRVGWPLVVRSVSKEKNLFATVGKNGAEAMKLAVAAMDSKVPAAPALPQGTCVVLNLRPINAVRSALSIIAPEVDAEALLHGLKDAPVTWSLRVGDGTASLVTAVPAAVPAAIIPLYQRLQRAHIRIDDLLNSPNMIKDDVPAPPPPK